MYNNIGGKIKGLAKIIFIIEAIAAIITAIFLIATNEYLVGVGLIVLFAGPLVAWISSWLLFGFGQLIENSDIIAGEYNRKNETHKKAAAKNNEKKDAQRRKAVTAIIQNPQISDDDFVDVVCTECNATLSFTKEQLQASELPTCPVCDAPLSF